MRRVLGMAVLIVVFAFVAGLTLPAHVQAGMAGPAGPAGPPGVAGPAGPAGAGASQAEKQKITELLKLHLLLSRGEHGSFHDGLEKLMKKYPNDADIKALSDEHHDMMHKRMATGEEAVDLLMKGHLITGSE